MFYSLVILNNGYIKYAAVSLILPRQSCIANKVLDVKEP